MPMSPSEPVFSVRWQESCARRSSPRSSRWLRKSGKHMSAQQIKRHTILLRKGDQVKVMSGRDAGKSGRVLAVNARKNTVLVEHANIIKHQSSLKTHKNNDGVIIEQDAGNNGSSGAIVGGRRVKHT